MKIIPNIILGILFLLIPQRDIRAQNDFAKNLLKREIELRDSLLNLLDPEEDLESSFDLLLKLGNLFEGPNRKESKRYFDSAGVVSLMIPDSLRHNISLLAIGKLERKHRNFALANNILSSLLPHFTQLNNKAKLSTLYHELADNYYQWGKLQLSLDHYLNALDLRDESTSYRHWASTVKKISKVFRELGQFEEAINYLKLIDFSNKNVDKKVEIRLFNNLGMTYYDMGLLDSSLFYFDKSLAISVELKARTFEHLARTWKGEIHIKQNHLALAQEEIDRAFKFYEIKKRNIPAMIRVRIAFASIFKIKKQYAKSAAHLEDALSIAIRRRRTFDKVRIIKELIDVYKLDKRYKESLDLSLNLAELRDSMMNIETSKKVQELKIQHETENNIKEIDRLKLTNELKSSRLSNQRNWIFSLIFGIGLLGWLTFRIFSQKAKIKNQNQVIGEALKEKEVLLKEIHHRVKNNLQVVSSLLSLQASTIEDTKAVEALTEGQQRVESMALIHKHLYKDHNVTKLSMKDYVSNLIQSAFQAHNIYNDQVRLISQIEDIDLDIADVVPIGLVMNELITNACKYAFTEGRMGILEVNVKKGQDYLIISISDDGIGSDDGDQGSGFGSKLVKGFVKKMDAEITRKEKDGYSVIIKVPLSKLNL